MRNKYFLTALVFFLLATILAGSFYLFYKNKQKNNSFAVLSEHPNVSLRTKNDPNTFLTYQDIPDILKKHNIKKIEITVTNTLQDSIQQSFGRGEAPYISHSQKIQNDILSVKVHVNLDILKQYDWTENDIANEMFLHVFMAIYDIDTIGQPGEKPTQIFINYKKENLPVPFEVTYDN